MITLQSTKNDNFLTGSSLEISSPKVSRENSTEIDRETRPSFCRNCSQQITPSNDTNDREKSISSTDHFLYQMQQESIQCWYTKMKSHMINYNLRELSLTSPAPVTISMVDQLLDELINTVDKCYKLEIFFILLQLSHLNTYMYIVYA